jgi:hypothetical protein
MRKRGASGLRQARCGTDDGASPSTSYPSATLLMHLAFPLSSQRPSQYPIKPTGRLSFTDMSDMYTHACVCVSMCAHVYVRA